MADLRLIDVKKSFGRVTVVHGVDLEVEDGELVVFVGPSGCGKSTLLRMIAGLEEISDGEILIDGELVNDVEAARRGLAMVFQSYALYPHMSVRKNMAFGLETLRTPRPVIEQRVAEAARILQLEPLLERRPAQLSGGQRQRVAIGRAIVREPRIFLFDEPLSNLDAELRVQMRVELARLHARLGTTMIYVTHDQVEAMTMADKIVVLRAGRIEQVGSPLALYNAPANRFVAGFIGSPQMNFLGVEVAAVGPAGTTVTLPGGGTVTVPRAGAVPGSRLVLGVRPEHLRPAEPGDLRAELLLTEQLGDETIFYGALPGGAGVTVKVPGQARRDGGGLDLALDADHCHLFDADGLALKRAA
jgi:ABC-type sugar transport system ATPase subunit